MPIASPKPTSLTPTPVQIKPEHKLPEHEVYKTATLDNAIIPPESTLAYMEGMAWAVDYYSQMVGEHDDIREVDIGQNASLQQYRKIKNLELRVQSDLTPNYDQETGITTVTGGAIAIQIIPNKYDYFITETGIKEKSLFMVTSVEQKSYMSKSVYEISYTLIGHISDPAVYDRHEALAYRTVQTFYFHKERITVNASPLLTEEQHGDAITLSRKLKGMYQTYFDMFTVSANRLLLVPDPLHRVYDTRVARFLISIVDSRDYPAISKLNYVTADREPYLSKNSIWTAIMMRSKDILKTTLNKVGYMPRGAFGTNSWLTSTNCWNLDYHVYPNHGDDNRAKRLTEGRNHPNHDALNMLTSLPPRLDDEDVSMWLDNLTIYKSETVSFIRPVHEGDYYVFSDAFYHNSNSNLSMLEILVNDYMASRPIDIKAVSLLAQQWETWPALEQFYYGPVIFLLIKDTVRGFY